MSITVTGNIVGKPNTNVTAVGTTAAEETTIFSGRPTTNNVTYEIEQRDGQPHWQGDVPSQNTNGIRVGGSQLDKSRFKITLSTWASASTFADVTSLSAVSVTLRLKPRTRYKVRIKWSVPLTPTAVTTSAWKLFETGDKNYRKPDAITSDVLGDETNPVTRLYPNKKVKNRIVVGNAAKSGVSVNTARGATVVNTDTGFLGTSEIRLTNPQREPRRRVNGRSVSNQRTVTKFHGNVTIVNENYYAQKKAGGRGPARRQPV